MKKVLLALLLSTSFAHAQSQQMGGYDNGISFIPTVQVASYSSGQAMGNLQNVQVFRTVSPPSWILTNFQLTAQDGATTPITIYTYDKKPTGTCTDKASFVESTADVSARFMAPFVLTPAVVGVGATSATAQLTQTVSGQNHDNPQTTNMYVCLVAGGTVTPGSVSNLVGKISGAQD